jgi:hypothetical protein
MMTVRHESVSPLSRTGIWGWEWELELELRLKLRLKLPVYFCFLYEPLKPRAGLDSKTSFGGFEASKVLSGFSAWL